MSQAQKENATLEKIGEGNLGLFTVRALWAEMPLDLFSQCIGTGNLNAGVQDLILKGPKLSESPPLESLFTLLHDPVKETGASICASDSQVFGLANQCRLLASFLYNP